MAKASLYSTASNEEQWQSVTGPWLRALAGTAWKNPRPTVVLTPSRSESFYLRGRLVKEKLNYLGLRFWTPSDARTFLLGELAPDVATANQSELQLIARFAAERLLKKKSAKDQPTLTSAAQDPGPFLRAYDLLVGAGWDPAESGASYGRGLAKEVKALLEEGGVATQAQVHSLLREELASQEKSPLLANLLVVGFNASHWPLWDLLQAIVSTSEQAVIALSRPHEFGGAVDRLWIGSWEERLYTTAETPDGPIDDDVDAPFASLIKSYENGTAGDASSADLSFLVAPDLATQAQAVVLQALDYLKRADCTRLGIVFPEPNALALEVADRLIKLGIPLDDGTGSLRPGLFEQRAWTTWIALQEEASVGHLGAWLRACEAQGLSSGLADVTALEAVDVLDQALGETLVDDLDFLSRYLEQNAPRKREAAVIDFLHQRIVLPDAATFSKFLELTCRALSGAGWENHLAKLQLQPAPWLSGSDWKLSRRTFLGWLQESTESWTRIRGTDGNHFYGKVHLVIYPQMTGQTWSHLILTGLNEGVWPRRFDAEAFGSRHELAALNQQARGLNRQSIKQGGQGEGHETVRAGHGYCLLPLERFDLSLRDLCAALEGASHGVSISAMTTEAGRSLLPSDFVNHAYQAKTNQVLDEEAFRTLANATTCWCARHESHLLTQATSLSTEIAATRIAYAARRDSRQPFGPYEFAFSESPAKLIQLSCKTWEDAWNHPATVWLDKIVGVGPWPDGNLSWPRAVGTWVHRWLKIALRTCQERKSVEDFPNLLQAAADAEATRAHNLARVAGLELYPWWEQVWAQAVGISRGLGESLVPVLSGKSFRSEYTLPENLLVALPGIDKDDFRLGGRIDLLVFETGHPAADDLTGCSCWVIDFKTGSASNLTAKKIAEGTGLQAVLYAMATQARGSTSASISLHTFDALLKPQVSLDAALEMTPLFRSLDIFHRAGIFGMRGDAQNEYGFSPAYPMATRFVLGSILESKWNLVHGGRTTDPGEDE